MNFRLTMQGYNYGAAKVLDVDWIGMVNEGALNKASGGSHPTNVYVDANGNLVCSIFFANIYVVTYNVISFCQLDSQRIIRGQLQGKVSLTSTVNF